MSHIKFYHLATCKRIPAKMEHDAMLIMLGDRLRRWPKIRLPQYAYSKVALLSNL